MCFCEWTKIRTTEGEADVQNLLVGDQIATRAGATSEITWIGRRGYIVSAIFLEDWEALVPVRIVQGALGEGIPQRDLLISPDHAICLDDKLIPVRHLINGGSIAYFDRPEGIRYFQLELATHEIFYAEGVAVESYRDVGDRNKFGNVLEGLAQARRMTRPSEPCLPMVSEDSALVQARKVVAERNLGLRLDRPLATMRPSRTHRMKSEVAAAVTGKLYRNIFDRNSDAAGFRYYTNCFMRGAKTIDKAIHEFFTSKEFINKCAGNQTLDQLSRRLLGGFLGHERFSNHDVTRIRAALVGDGVGQAVDTLLSDPRFREHHGIMGVPRY